MKEGSADVIVIGGGIHDCSSIEVRHRLRYEARRDRLQDPGPHARTVTDLFPFLKEVQVNRAWSGIEGFLPDKLPVIGPSRVAPGFIHAFGFLRQWIPAGGRR